MTITFSPTEAHRGFLLAAPLTHEGKILVLTGWNGSGKSRFLESLEAGNTKCQFDGRAVDPSDIKLFKSSNITANVRTQIHIAQSENTIENFVAQYQQRKSKVKVPVTDRDRTDESALRGRSLDNILPDWEIYDTAMLIGQRVGKEWDALLPSEIRLYFRELRHFQFGSLNLGGDVSSYLYRKQINERQKWEATRDKDIKFVDDEAFVSAFGEPPWVAFNERLNQIFNGKFELTEPPAEIQRFGFQASLVDNTSQTEVSKITLSSGENTLLWLVVMAFNAWHPDTDPDSAPDLVLLDDADAFLHPKMAKQMFDILNEN